MKSKESPEPVIGKLTSPGSNPRFVGTVTLNSAILESVPEAIGVTSLVTVDVNCTEKTWPAVKVKYFVLIERR
jgi:hypothetical protein